MYHMARVEYFRYVCDWVSWLCRCGVSAGWDIDRMILNGSIILRLTILESGELRIRSMRASRAGPTILPILVYL